MKTIIFATHNENKADEIRNLLPEGLQLQTLNDLDIKEEIPETGSTLDENALIKARFIYENFGKACFSDDTGLEVESLNGEPGVYSARYAGLEKSAEANMKKLLEKLADETNRQAQFRTSLAYINESGKELLFEGIVEGEISHEKQGEKGFGYDPIFIPSGYDLSFAQMTQSAKNKISHRARAIAKFLQHLSLQKS